MQLAKKAMLVSVNIVNGGLLGERRDTTASNLVQSTYGTADRRTKASKYLIDRKHKSVKRVVAASQRVREVVYRYTLPWGDDKARLLPVKLSGQFEYDLKKSLRELHEAREDYVREFPNLVAASEVDLSSLFDKSQYPDPDRVMEMFSSKVRYWPIPESNHFIADINQEAADEAKAGIEAEIEQRLLDATYDMVRRAKEVVSNYVDRLAAFKLVPNTSKDDWRTGQKGYDVQNSFRDSLVDNIKDTANLIERMNLTDNAQITNVVRDLRRLTKYTADQLRTPNQNAQKWRETSLTQGQQVLALLNMMDLKDEEVSNMVADAGDYMDM